MALNLNGSALVTGAGGGVGRACAEQLVRDRCHQLLLTDVHAESLQETARLVKQVNPGAEIITEICDVRQDSASQHLVNVAVKHFGRLDYALNVAGVGGDSKPIVDMSTSNYDFVSDVNARAVWLLHKAEISQMLKQEPIPTHDGRPGNRGAIVTVSSNAGIIGYPNQTAYVMSKHAVVGLVKSDAITYANQGIRINAVCPGVIDTQLVRFEGSTNFAQTFVETWTPMKRMATPVEIADVILFLCSSRASYMTGSSVIVDGGQTAL